jgi:spermidine/putrescine-binding protein
MARKYTALIFVFWVLFLGQLPAQNSRAYKTGPFDCLAGRYNSTSTAVYACHATLSFGTELKVTNLENNKSLMVPVGWRIAPSARAGLELSPSAADLLSLPASGLVRVHVEPIIRNRSGLTRSPGKIQDSMIQSRGGPDTLVLYTWKNMFPKSILEGFEKLTGIKVKYNTFNVDEDMLATLETSSGTAADLIIADAYIVQFAINEGLVRKLDKDKIPNLGNVNPLYQYQYYDPENDYTVPYGAGILCLVYDPALTGRDLDSYADLWAPDLRGQVGVPGNYRIVDGMVLKMLGKSYNNESVDDIIAAGRQLILLAPNVYEAKESGLGDDMISGMISAALMYSGEAARAVEADPRLKIAYPREGIAFDIQAAFIASGAANPGAAEQFLNYILDPKRGAECFEYTDDYCTYSASEPYLSPGESRYLIAPDFGRYELIENINEAADTAQRGIWDAFLSALARNN